MYCKYCHGCSYTDKPFKVITQQDAERMVQFNYCPNCGRKLRPARPPADLTGKCGSCTYAVPAPEAFGGSPCYVKCTNEEHMRRYYERPIARVRQRTAKACKKYQPKEVQHGTE